MARYMGPRFKQCRRLGVNVCGHPKAMNRANDAAFARRKKPTDYSRQLTEKQKLKAYYGILEKQLRRYFDKADEILFKFLFHFTPAHHATPLSCPASLLHR